MHVTSDLSAYIDQELAPAEQARVSAHLGTCRACAARLAELRATAALISALPEARPARSLVPALAPRWNWLRPVRSLSAFASGAFVMVFLVAAVAQSGSDLGGGPTSPFSRMTDPQPAAAPAAPGAGFDTAASTAPAVPQAELAAATKPPERNAVGAAGTPPDANASPTTETLATTEQAEDSDKRGAAADLRANVGLDSQAPSPLIWLALALFLAVIAGVSHWRLRAG